MYRDGRAEDIAFTEKDNFIIKQQDERGEKFQHEAVQLSLPVPFLKVNVSHVPLGPIV